MNGKIVSVSGWGSRLGAAALVAVLAACCQGTEADDTQEQDVAATEEDDALAVEEEQQDPLDDEQEEAATEGEEEASMDPQLAEECDDYLAVARDVIAANDTFDAVLDEQIADEFEPGQVDEEVAELVAALEDYRAEVAAFEHDDLQEFSDPLVKISGDASELYEAVYSEGDLDREQEFLEIGVEWSAVEMEINEVCDLKQSDFDEES